MTALDAEHVANVAGYIADSGRDEPVSDNLFDALMHHQIVSTHNITIRPDGALRVGTKDKYGWALPPRAQKQ